MEFARVTGRAYVEIGIVSSNTVLTRLARFQNRIATVVPADFLNYREAEAGPIRFALAHKGLKQARTNIFRNARAVISHSDFNTGRRRSHRDVHFS